MISGISTQNNTNFKGAIMIKNPSFRPRVIESFQRAFGEDININQNLTKPGHLSFRFNLDTTPERELRASGFLKKFDVPHVHYAKPQITHEEFCNFHKFTTMG